jgi:hypothetical protein
MDARLLWIGSGNAHITGDTPAMTVELTARRSPIQCSQSPVPNRMYCLTALCSSNNSALPRVARYGGSCTAAGELR